ncbi:MAG: TonB family protein [bacterium]|nr:TonB family protein [bacterium]
MMMGKTAITTILTAAVLLFLIPASGVWAMEGPVEQTGALEIYKDAKMAIYQKDWAKAVELLKGFKADFSGSTYFDDSLYWLAYSLHKLKRYDKALKNLDELIGTCKGSSWVDDAEVLRVKIAAALVRGGQERYMKYILNAVRAGTGFRPGISPDTKVVALDALLRIDVDRALPYIEKALKKAKSDAFRAKLVFMLRGVGDKRVRALLRGTLLEKPRWVRRVEPVFPIEALKEHIQGDVVLEVVTDPGGYVVEAKVTRGHPLLRDAAIQAVKRWKHEPTPVDGKPISRVFEVTLTFEIY